MILGAYSPERRPMPTRNWSASKRLAGHLIKREVSPNVISILGMFSGIAAGLALGLTSFAAFAPAGFLIALLGIALRGVGNLMDGMVAVGSGHASPVGELYNEVPDRLADAFILVGAGYAAGGNPTLGWLAASLALLTAYVRAQGKAVGAHQEFCGPMAKPQRMVIVAAACLYSAVFGRFGATTWTLGGVEFGAFSAALLVIVLGSAWTTGRRLRRIAAALKQPKG